MSAWVEFAQFTLTKNWQFSNAIEGRFFRVRHLQGRRVFNGWIAQGDFVSPSLPVLSEVRGLFCKEESDLYEFPEPIAFGVRAIAVKRLDDSLSPWLLAVDVLDFAVGENSNVYEEFSSAAAALSGFLEDRGMTGTAAAIAAHEAAVNPHFEYALSSTLAAKADLAAITYALTLKADSAVMTTALALKADSAAMTTALALKADSAVMTTALALKADLAAMTTALALKADLAAMTTALALKADSAAMTAALALKADLTAMTTALALKADLTAMTTALAAKANLTAMTTALATKADLTAMTTALAAKADLTAMTAALALKGDVLTLAVQTNDATLTEMVIPQRVLIHANSSAGYEIRMTGHSMGATPEFIYWLGSGAIYRGAAASSTILQTATGTKRSTLGNGSNWTPTISADTVNGALKIQVKGDPSKSIKWVASVQLTEVW